MIITLTGSNSFLLRRELSQLTDAFVAEYTDIGLERLDGEAVSFDRIRESLESLPFLASKKMVVLFVPSTNKEFIQKFDKLLKGLPETTDLVIVEPKLDRRSSYYKFLQKQTNYKEFFELDEPALSQWSTEEVKDQGGSLSTADARYLVERVGVNQQLLWGELTKLLAYNPNITRQNIDLLTEPSPQSTIFELLDAAMLGQKQRVLAVYAEQRAMKVEPPQIMALLIWQLHILALVKVAGNRDPSSIAKEAKVSPFVIRKSLNLARRLTLDKVKELIKTALALDIRLKSQPIDVDESLTHLLTSI